MTKSIQKILFLAPRGFTILFIFFLTLFAFDVFGTGEPWHMQILKFIVHLIPQYILIAALILAWRHERLGGILFLTLYLVAVITFQSEMIGMILFTPLILIGVLFLIQSIQEQKTSEKISVTDKDTNKNS